MENQEKAFMGWKRFVAMIAVSTGIMFCLMYQLVYRLDDALFSLNRMLASLIMGLIMAAVMLGFMWPMYEGQRLKVSIMLASLLGAASLLYVNRDQSLVSDVTFMQAMIPHHSIAINNAERARIADPRVRKLADGIIASQVKEIAEMKLLIADIEKNGKRGKGRLGARSAAITPDMEPQILEAVR